MLIKFASPYIKIMEGEAIGNGEMAILKVLLAIRCKRYSRLRSPSH